MGSDTMILFTVGIVGGFMAGFAGLGGGLLYVTILPSILSGYNLQESELVRFVIANSIFCIFLTSVSGNFSQVVQRRFYRREVLLVSGAGVVAAVFSLKLVVYQNWYSKEVFKIILLPILLVVLVQTLNRSSIRARFTREKSLSWKKLCFAGVISGSSAALSGLGGGALLMSFLTQKLRVNVKKAKSISLGLIFSVTGAVTIFNLLAISKSAPGSSVGFVIFPVAIPMAAGGLISAWVGVRLSRRSPSFIINYSFALFLGIVIIKEAFELFDLLYYA